MFLEISKNSKENTCASFFLIKLQTFYTEYLWTTASDIIYLKYKFEQIGPRIKALLYLHENWHTIDNLKRVNADTIWLKDLRKCPSSVQYLWDRRENLLSS